MDVFVLVLFRIWNLYFLDSNESLYLRIFSQSLTESLTESLSHSVTLKVQSDFSSSKKEARDFPCHKNVWRVFGRQSDSLSLSIFTFSPFLSLILFSSSWFESVDVFVLVKFRSTDSDADFWPKKSTDSRIPDADSDCQPCNINYSRISWLLGRFFKGVWWSPKSFLSSTKIWEVIGFVTAEMKVLHF